PTRHISPLSLHDALPISGAGEPSRNRTAVAAPMMAARTRKNRSKSPRSSKSWLMALASPAAKKAPPIQGQGLVHSRGKEKEVVRSEEHTSELQSPYDLVC